MPKIEVKDKFPVFVGEYPFHQKLRDELVPQLESYPDLHGKKTNVKATMTDWNWNSKSVQIKKLKLYIIDILQKEFRYKSIVEDTPPIGFKNFWGNIYHKGDYAQLHDHWPWAQFSFAYFLKSKWYYSPLIFGANYARVRPKEGRFVLFKSFMRHYVPQHRFNDTRITLSGNLVCDWSGMEGYRN